jgi:hypothetical protein
MLRYRNSFVSLVALVLMLLGTGCAKLSLHPNDDFLSENAADRDSRQAADMQAARGARADGMLRAVHFDGSNLNSLGQQRIQLMMRDNESSLPLVVYVNLPAEDSLATARREAVESHLKELGLKADQFRVEAGPNPASSSMAADRIAEKASQSAGVTGAGAGATAAPAAEGASIAK